MWHFTNLSRADLVLSVSKQATEDDRLSSPTNLFSTMIFTASSESFSLSMPTVWKLMTNSAWTTVLMVVRFGRSKSAGHEGATSKTFNGMTTRVSQ